MPPSESKLYYFEGVCASHVKVAGTFLIATIFFSYYAFIHMGRKTPEDSLNFPIVTVPVAILLFAACLRSATYAMRAWWIVQRLRTVTTTTAEGASLTLVHLDN